MLSAAKRLFTSVLVWYKEVHTSDIFRHTVHFLVFLGAVQSIQIISVSPGQQWPGFSFVLHLLSVQGFYFCPAAIQPHTSVYSGFCIIHATIPPTLQNSAQGFAGSFPSICRVLPLPCVGCIQLYRTACATLECLPTPGRFAPIPDTNAAPDTTQVSAAALL